MEILSSLMQLFKSNFHQNILKCLCPKKINIFFILLIKNHLYVLSNICIIEAIYTFLIWFLVFDDEQQGAY